MSIRDLRGKLGRYKCFVTGENYLNGISVEAGVLKQGDISMMRGRLEKIDRWLALEDETPLSRAVLECFEVWQGLLPLQMENDYAKIALSAFYQKGRIQDFLNKLWNFVDRVDTVDSDETARELGYYNYLFFIKQFVENMVAEHEKAISKLFQKPPDRTPDNVAWFIGTECGNIASIQELPKVRVAARQMLDWAEVGKQPPEKFNDVISGLSTALDLLKEGERTSRGVSELEELAETLKARAAVLRENIEKGTKLYENLVSKMTETWFQQFDPETEAVQKMTRMELKTFYQEKLAALELPKE